MLALCILIFLLGALIGAWFMWTPKKKALDSGYIMFQGEVYKVEKIVNENKSKKNSN